MTEPRAVSRQVELHADDSDLHKGAIVGPPDGYGNPNAEGALDEDGWPRDEMLIAVLAGGRGRIRGIPSTKRAKTPLIVPIVMTRWAW